MKLLSGFFRCCAIIAAIATVPACRKDHQTPPPPPSTRTIEYRLYTEQDFSNVSDSIIFNLYMRSSDGHKLLDSALAPMLVKEIPNKAHQLVFRKEVPAGHEKDDLVVGFTYYLVNIGYSWYLDTCKAGQPLKIMEYSFK